MNYQIKNNWRNWIMNMILVGNEMQAVIDAVVKYKSDVEDRLCLEMSSLIAVMDERDVEIAELEEVVEVLVDDNRELLAEVDELKAKLAISNMMISERERAMRELVDMVTAAAAPKPRGYAEFIKQERKMEEIAKAQASCCEQGFCGTDKCGGSCDETSRAKPSLHEVPSVGAFSFMGYDDSFF